MTAVNHMSVSKLHKNVQQSPQRGLKYHLSFRMTLNKDTKRVCLKEEASRRKLNVLI